MPYSPPPPPTKAEHFATRSWSECYDRINRINSNCTFSFLSSFISISIVSNDFTFTGTYWRWHLQASQTLHCIWKISVKKLYYKSPTNSVSGSTNLCLNTWHGIHLSNLRVTWLPYFSLSSPLFYQIQPYLKTDQPEPTLPCFTHVPSFFELIDCISARCPLFLCVQYFYCSENKLFNGWVVPIWYI